MSGLEHRSHCHHAVVLECVVNVSEGRRRDVVDMLTAAGGRSLLDTHVDGDHHRSVFTLAGLDVEYAVRDLAAAAVSMLDLREHHGVHPRVGVVDVVPFVPLAGSTMVDAVAAARRTAVWIGAELGVPTFLYGGADPEGRLLPSVRHEAFTTRVPDAGPDLPHPTAGAVCVGARPLLVAVNCQLVTADVGVAQRIARSIRERDGGLAGVRALGFALASRKQAQVSMNLVDLAATGIEAACAAVEHAARVEGTSMAGIELVGLVPAAELTRCTPEFLGRAGISAGQTIEARLTRAGLAP